MDNPLKQEATILYAYPSLPQLAFAVIQTHRHATRSSSPRKTRMMGPLGFFAPGSFA